MQALTTIRFRKPPFGSPATVVNLSTGQTATLGSPVTAGSDNVDVELYNDALIPAVEEDPSELLGEFELDDQESANVEFPSPETAEVTMLVGDTIVMIPGQPPQPIEQGDPPVTVGLIEVAIDIKPNDRRNVLDLTTRDRISVAILSTADFNAPERVNRSSLTFGQTGDEPSLISCRRRGVDTNGDGRADLLCNFKRNRAHFRPGDTLGTLRGETTNGAPIEGSDMVRVVARLGGNIINARLIAPPANPASSQVTDRSGSSPQAISSSQPACLDDARAEGPTYRACNTAPAEWVDAAIATLVSPRRHRFSERFDIEDSGHDSEFGSFGPGLF